MKNVFYIVLLLTLLVSCGVEEESRKEYYYSFAKTTEAKVYKYVIDGDENQVQYCKVTSIPESAVIVTETYNTDLVCTEKFEEIITDQGAELLGFTEYKLDSNQNWITIKTKVIKKDVYRWNSKFSYSFSFEYPAEHGGNTVTKTRTQSELENITIGGKEYATATFNDEYIFQKEEIKQKNKIKSTLFQKTFYAKGLGIVKMERRLPGADEVMNFELTDILTNEEFDEMLKKSINN